MRHMMLNPEKYATAVSIRDFFMYEVKTTTTPPPTVIITGRPGPTGKSWLREELRAMGYNAIEITGSLYLFVEYTDYKNHVVLDEFNNLVMVILNKTMEGM